MHTNIVAEIGSWHSPDEVEDIIDASVHANRIGVVIKGTQGVEWTRGRYDTIYADVTGAGLLVGHLHYCEPGVNTSEDEAVFLLGSFRGRPYPLGVWLEVDELFGLPEYNAATWVNEVAGAISTPERRGAVVATPTMFAALAGLDGGLRRVATTIDGLNGETYWAVAAERGGGVSSPDSFYILASTRGLNPVVSHSPVIARVEDPDEETEDDESEDELINPEVPELEQSII